MASPRAAFPIFSQEALFQALYPCGSLLVFSCKERGENLFSDKEYRLWEREERQVWTYQLWNPIYPFLQYPGHHWGPRDGPLLGCFAATVHRGETLSPALVCHLPLTAVMGPEGVSDLPRVIEQMA